MKLSLYSLRDIKVGYRSVISMHNDEEAKRSCAFAVNSGNKDDICLCPQDFEMWRVATFDDSTGEIVPDKEFIVNLGELVHKPKSEV